MNPQGDPNGIYVPIQLDTSKAEQQFEKLGETIKEGFSPQNDFEKFMAGVQTNLDLATKATKKFQLNMSALSRETAVFGHAFDGVTKSSSRMNIGQLASRAYRPGVMDMGKLANSGAVNAAEQSRLKQENEEKYRKMFSKLSGAAPFTMDMGSLAKSSPDYEANQRKMLARSRLTDRQNSYGKVAGYAAHLYGENRSGFNAAGAMAGSVGKYAGFAGAGLVASGFHGTVEGERLARELRVLSLELAASFKPLVDGLTRVTRGAREWAQSLSPEGQNRLQTAGSIAAGAYVGYKIGSFAGPKGAAAGAVIGGITGGVMSQESINAARDQLQQEKEFARDKYILEMAPEKRGDEIEKRRKKILSDFDSEKKTFGMTDYTSAKNKLEVLKEIEQKTQREIAINDKKKRGVALTEDEQEIYDSSKYNPNRRQVMLTEGVGFAGAGSTFQAIQEDVLRTTATETAMTNQKLDSVTDQLKDLNTNVKALNK